MNAATMDAWISSKIGAPLTRASLEEYQLRKINETLALAGERSAYYAPLRGQRLASLSELAALPFTTPQELFAAPYSFLCVSPREVERIVTVPTSGSSGSAKRVFFTAEDLELCADFFHYGMRLVVRETDRVGMLFPAKTPGSVGDLLREGLSRDGIIAMPLYEYSRDLAALAAEIERENITALVGFPALIEALALSAPQLGVERVLLSADYVSPECKSNIKKSWGAECFEHYGLTESGLGFAVSCAAHAGCHIREADIYTEIIDPETGKNLPDGEWGEVVFTTLTRRAMPLIRYRTGDTSRIIPGSCPCASLLRRLDSPRDRGLRKKLPPVTPQGTDAPRGL